MLAFSWQFFFLHYCSHFRQEFVLLELQQFSVLFFLSLTQPLSALLFFHGMLRFVFLFKKLLSHSLHHIMTGHSICGGKVKVTTVF